MSKGTFRLLVIVDVLLAVMAAIADFAFQSYLPETLRQYLENEGAEFENNPMMWLLAFGGLSVAAVGIASLVGLLLFWRPARLLYTLAFLLSWPLYLIAGPTVSTAAAHMLYEMSSVLAGVIWALIYFSPLKVHFERPTDPLAP